MNEDVKKNSINLRRWTVFFALVVMLVGFGIPGFGQDDDTSARVEALERALQEIKASMQAGQDVTARVAALEKQLEQLKADLAADEASKAATPAPPAATPTSAAGATPQLPPAGVQGSPNPLTDNTRYLTGQDLLDEGFPNSIPIFGAETRFTIGGYAKLDFIHDLDYVGDRFEFELATIPVEGTPQAALGGRTTADAKETRINFDFRRTAHWKNSKEFPLQVFVELDFFDDRETFALQPRLRHAYGVIGRFLAGQTWSTSGDLEALAGTIDFSGGDALYGARVAQIRWQDRASKHVSWAVGLEDPKSSIGNPFGLGGEDRPELPNLGGRVRWTANDGSHVQLGADLFRLDWQGGDAGPSDSAVGFGLNLTGRWLLGRNRNDALVAGAQIGRGSANRVIVLSFDGGNDAVITSDGLDVMSNRLAYIGYSHYWTDSLNSTVSTNWAELDNSEFQPGSAIHRGRSFHLNLIWFPYKLVSTGGEIMWGERVNKDGAKGEAWRFQYMVKYKFN